MNIAIIGTGISGNVAAYHLSKTHQVTVFEKNDYVGGHTHTHSISIESQTHSVDSGFIVFNDRTYPNFNALLSELGVKTQKTEMSFSMKSDIDGLEYKGSGLNGMFAQRRNIFKPRFYKLIVEIVRFNKMAKAFIQSPNDESLNSFLNRNGFSDYFSAHYLLPMGAAITEGFKDSISLNAKITAVRRADNGVYVQRSGEAEQFFDAVFIASHSDQALDMLSDASALEKQVLGAIKYQENQAIMHTDVSVLPKQRQAWAAWNYHLTEQPSDKNAPVALSYNMNILQGLNSVETVCVTLNNSKAINPKKVIKKLEYEHPIFTPDSVHAQSRQADINGPLNTYFCGAYWGNGFHEDGVVSALNALKQFQQTIG